MAIVGASEIIRAAVADLARRKGDDFRFRRLTDLQHDALDRIAYSAWRIEDQHEDGTITVRGSGIGYGSIAPDGTFTRWT